jgi:hypothetical protein
MLSLALIPFVTTALNHMIAQNVGRILTECDEHRMNAYGQINVDAPLFMHRI